MTTLYLEGSFVDQTQTVAALNAARGRRKMSLGKICWTDPNATMATNARNRRLEPSYKQHTAVDDKVGVILDVAVTTGQTNEGEMIEPQLIPSSKCRD
ncbi:transposase [Bradyrhizobium sp. LCT2]|uniref:transposase n=1 Tax=unclassified Bradyrhizobium TaxID=2631580 RepID=UPI00352C6BCB